MIKKFFLTTFLIGIFLLTNYVEHNYAIDGTVINENSIEDITGNVWEVDYIPYRDDSIVKIHFNDNCTIDTRKDDVITKIILKNY